MVLPRARIARDIWWVFLVILIANTVVVSFNIIRSARNDKDVRQSLQVLNTLNRFQNALVAAESGARGFDIAGTEDYLEPYTKALTDLPILQNQLQILTKGNAEQRQRLEAMAPDLDRRLKLMDELISARRLPNRDTAKEIALVAQGKQAMGAIRLAIRNMLDEELNLLESRRRVARQTLDTTIYSAVIGGGISIGILILAYYLMRREDKIRRRSEEALRESGERFRTIAESLPQLVWVTGPNGEPDFCNRRWRSYTGLSPDQNLSWNWTTPVDPDDRAHLDEFWKRSLETSDPFQSEARFRAANGQYRWFLVRVVAIKDPQGATVCWIVTATDIHDQKTINEQLEARVKARTAELQRAVSELHTEAHERERTTAELHVMTLELARSNKELEQFAYLASHDLQEPLRKIQSFGDRLKTKHSDHLNEQGREYIERMQNSATRMRRLIDDLLSFSRVVTRPHPFEEVDLGAVVQDVLSDLEDAIHRTGAKIEVGPLPSIRADALQMHQLMQNLLTNAIKFHKPDEPPIVAIQATMTELEGDAKAATPTRKAVRIDVIDHGIGFDNVYCNRIFDIFQRLHGRGEYEGTGIGLAVVRKIAERHGGSATATSEPGRGSTFSVVLPICQTDNLTDITPQTAESTIS